MEQAATPFEQMDRMYRYQRYIYDASRKFYLLGRDTLLATIAADAPTNVLEVGCGTGRNLAMLAKRLPEADLYGLDASADMLEFAIRNTVDKGLGRVTLRTALAQEFGHRETFGAEQPFDAIFFSYSISMIPPWRESIANALNNLKPGGRIYIVDFYDQADLPTWFRKMLTAWLRKFHVQFWGDLMPYLKQLETDGICRVEIRSVARRYAFIAVIST